MAHFNPYTGNYGLQPDPRPLVPPGPNYGDKTPALPVPQRGIGNLYGDTINDADVTARDDQRFDWNDIGVGAYSALDELLMGIPTWLVKGVGGSDTYKKLQNWRQQNKAASDYGQTAGFIGSMFIPGGAVVKGAGKALGVGGKLLGAGKLAEKLGKGAKTLDVLGDVISGGKKISELGQGLTKAGRVAKGAKEAARLAKSVEDLRSFGTLGKVLSSRPVRGAIGAAETAIPSALFDTRYGTEGERLQSALGSIATGGLLGMIGKKPTTQKQIAGEDLIRGGTTRHLEDLKEKLVASEFKSATDATAASLRRWGKEKFGRAWENTLAKRGDDIIEEYNSKLKALGIDDPTKLEDVYKGVRAKMDIVNDALTSQGAKVADYTSDILERPSVKKALAPFGERGITQAQEIISEINQADNFPHALNVLNEWDDQFYKAQSVSPDRLNVRMGDVIDELRDALRKPMDEVGDIVLQKPGAMKDLREAYAVTMIGKPSIARGAIEMPVKSGGSPTWEKAALGAILGGSAPEIAGIDKDDPNYNLYRLMAAAGGSLGGTALNKFLPQIKQKIGGKLAGVGAEVLSPENIAKAQALATKAESVAGDIRPFLPEIEKLTGRLPAVKAGIAQESAGGVQNQIEEEAKQEANSGYDAIIKDRLGRYYSAYFADQMSYDDFENAIRAKTNNLDPRMTAGILFPNKAEREAYLANYENIRRLKELQFRDVLGYASQRGGWGGPSPVSKKAYADFVNTIAAIESGKAGLPSREKQKQIDAYLQTVFDLPISDAEKQAVLEDFLETQMGVPLSLYKQAGIYG